ncbi:TPA: hypothetical protein ACP445_003645 [Klebsiella pneumoniae]
MKILATLRRNPYIYNFCRTVLIIYSVACAGIIIYKQAFPASRALDANAREFYNKYQPPSERDTTFTPSLLSHRIIALDADDGIIGAAATSDALANVNHYLSTVARHCHYAPGGKTAAEYLDCANGVLHDHFYYHSADDAGRGYAEHNSDCDANTFLIMDAANAAGLPTYIVYAPGHAFIAWKDDYGKFRYHETTGGNNKGSPFDFRNRLYKKTMDRTYYSPRAYGDPVILATYRALTSSVSGHGGELSKLIKRYPDNTLIESALFRWKRQHGTLSPDDVTRIESALITDITDSGLYLSLTDFYLRAGSRERAREAFDRVPARDCGNECYEYGIRLGITKFRLMNPVWKPYSAYMSGHGVSANTWTFWGVWPKLLILLVVLAFIIHWVLTANNPEQEN